MISTKKIYAGYDLGNEYSQIGYIEEGMDQPVLVSTVAGEDRFMIPTVLFRNAVTGQYLYGEEAVKAYEDPDCEGILIDDLLSKAVSGEHITVDNEIIPCAQLLEIFVKKTLGILTSLVRVSDIRYLTFAAQDVTEESVAAIEEVLQNLTVPREVIKIIDYKESFFNYVVNNNTDYLRSEAALITLCRKQISTYILSTNLYSVPKVSGVKLVEGPELFVEEEPLRKDYEFGLYVKNTFANRRVAAVYLTGEGFQGDWIKNSVKPLCDGKKAYIGQNLYVEGACMYSKNIDSEKRFNYVYMGNLKVLNNIGINVQELEGERFIPLVESGINWYESARDVDVILDEGNTIEFIVQSPMEKTSRTESVVLEGLPLRENKTTRLRIETKFINRNTINFKITDMGFGDIFKGSFKEWNYSVTI